MKIIEMKDIQTIARNSFWEEFGEEKLIAVIEALEI
jgi:hypothetical protein